MRRRWLVPLVGASLLGTPAVASASPEACSQAVRDVRGTHPPYASIAAELKKAADVHGVPAQVLRAIAYVESGWRQFKSDGSPLISTGDDVCGLGVMQVTADGYPEADQVRLAKEYAYNIDQGAKILRQKWLISLETPPPAGAGPDSPDVVENWYYAICLYNGCGSDATYPTKVANVMADPFRYAPNFSVLRPYWFTKPQDADPSYVFPGAFQARYGPAQEFVFYDHTTGTVTKTVAAPTHSLTQTGAPLTTYPVNEAGPDAGSRVTCQQCGGWRLAEGVGRIGRAHWTNTVTGPDQSVVQWAAPRDGPYRVSAYVPALGDTVLGTATYGVNSGTKTVDQDAVKGTWVPLGDHWLGSWPSVRLGDSSAVPGQPIVADAVRFAKKTTLAIGISGQSAVYGSKTSIGATLRHGNQPVSGQPVRYYRRPLGTTTWKYVATAHTRTTGTAALAVTARENVEYYAKFVPADAGHIGSQTKPVTLWVRPWMSLRAPDSVRRSTAFALDAVVKPAHAGYRLYLQRATSRGWQNVTSAVLSAYGTARFRITAPATTGYQYYRTFLPGHGDHLAGSLPRLPVLIT